MKPAAAPEEKPSEDVKQPDAEHVPDLPSVPTKEPHHPEQPEAKKVKLDEGSEPSKE